ncbi:M15 family metallopeptidase, partial [Ochrobactrum sp. GRS2]|nr:M15 family metallopeptidase [Ochrobactrum sp. GRS2]
FGMAVDIIHGTKAYDLDRKAWSLLSHIGKEISVQAGIPVTWGGDWKFYDPAHWELKNWKALREKT